MTRSCFLTVSALTLALAAGCNRGTTPTADHTSGTPSASAAAAAGGHGLLSVSAKLVETGRIVVEPATLASPKDDLIVTGQITASPDGAAEVGAPTAGRVRDILVREGDTVSKGAKLATLDSAEITRTATDLGRAVARRDHAERVLRQEEQLMRENATSERR